jgi:diguanylate cyclase (GGDEF)-like protein
LLDRGSGGHTQTGAPSLAITASTGAGLLGTGVLGGSAGLLGGSASTHGAGSVFAKLAPATAAIGTRSHVAVHRTHARRGRFHLNTILPPLGLLSSAGIDIIHVVPTPVWIALAGALALAAVAGAAAFRSARRARLKAGEIAAATAAALTDPLTGILNRRGFIESAERELDRARRYQHPLALAFADIRGLKAVNDSEGHLAGDNLLKQASQLLHESARSNDVVGRIGGDELAVLLPEQSAEGAEAMIQRVRAQVPAYRASLGLATGWDMTIGTSSFPEDGDNFEELMAAADRRLYQQRGINLAR